MKSKKKENSPLVVKSAFPNKKITFFKEVPILDNDNPLALTLSLEGISCDVHRLKNKNLTSCEMHYIFKSTKLMFATNQIK